MSLQEQAVLKGLLEPQLPSLDADGQRGLTGTQIVP